MNIENELKLIPTKGITREQLVEILKKQGIIVPEKGKVIHQEDTYFDDKTGTLEKSGGSFRIRRKNNIIQVTYKIPVESDTKYKQRKEYEIVVPKKYEQSLDLDLAIKLLSERYQELTFPENMGEILTVINNRNKTDITCPDGTVLEMAFDDLQGKDGQGNIYDIRPEIEFETISGNAKNLDYISTAIEQEFPGQTKGNSLSKYARTKKEIKEKSLTIEEVATCAIFSEILNSVEYNKLQHKGQILHRYDKPTVTNLDNFKNFDYLVEKLKQIKCGEYKIPIPRDIAQRPEMAKLLEGENYEIKDDINLEDMMCILLSDVKYDIADDVLADFLNKNYYGEEHAMTNRLSHSQQVMLVSGLVAKSSVVGASFEDKLTSMVSALSHDIGHVPMAHTLEAKLKEIDGLFSHEINGKRTLENIFRKSEKYITSIVYRHFPELSISEIKEKIEDKLADIKLGIVNHSRKGAEFFVEEGGINSQAARLSDKICYSSSDICDLIRYSKTVLGKDVEIVTDEWVKQTMLEICDGNEQLAIDMEKRLDSQFIQYLKSGDYGTAVVNSANSVRCHDHGDSKVYEVDQDMWKFIKKLIARVKDVRGEMGLEEAKTSMNKAAEEYVDEVFYKEYIGNGKNIDLAWENLLKKVTSLGELDILHYIYERYQDAKVEQLAEETTITQEQASNIIEKIKEKAFEAFKERGLSDKQAKKSAEKLRGDLSSLTPEKVLEYLKKYKDKIFPKRYDEREVQRIKEVLHSMADVQLKIKPSSSEVNLNSIWNELKIPNPESERGNMPPQNVRDEYYHGKYNGQVQPNVKIKVRHIYGKKTKTLIVKVPIEKNVSERMQKKYVYEGELDLSVDEMLQRLMGKYPGLDIELTGNEPYESINIERTSYVRYFQGNECVFSQDTFRGNNGQLHQEIEIKSLCDPRDVIKMKDKLKRRFAKYFITDSKIKRVTGHKDNGLYIDSK